MSIMGNCITNKIKTVFIFIFMSIVILGNSVISYGDIITDTSETNQIDTTPSGDTFYEPIVYKDGQRQILTFRDVNNDNHWASATIKWALANKLMVGYKNWEFRPDAFITEAEFLSIFVKMQANIDKSKIVQQKGEHWAQGYYDAIENYEIPFNGYNNDDVKNSPITRGQVAIIMAAKYGFNLTEKQAVYFMYENNFSKGSVINQKTFESYKVDSTLTRAQAITFLKETLNFKDTKITFNGKTAIKQGKFDMLIGIKDVPLDSSLEVNFDRFIADQIVTPEYTKLTVSKGKDGYMHADHLKITLEKPMLGTDGKYYINHFIFKGLRSEFNYLANSIVEYKGVELPSTVAIGDFSEDPNFKVGIAVYDKIYQDEGIYDDVFVDKDAFIKLSENLSKFGATKEQIKILQDYTNKYYGYHKANENSGEEFLYIHSKSKKNTLLVLYGCGSVKGWLYNNYDEGVGYFTHKYVK